MPSFLLSLHVHVFVYTLLTTFVILQSLSVWLSQSLMNAHLQILCLAYSKTTVTVHIVINIHIVGVVVLHTLLHRHAAQLQLYNLPIIF